MIEALGCFLVAHVVVSRKGVLGAELRWIHLACQRVNLDTPGYGEVESVSNRSVWRSPLVRFR